MTAQEAGLLSEEVMASWEAGGRKAGCCSSSSLTHQGEHAAGEPEAWVPRCYLLQGLSVMDRCPQHMAFCHLTWRVQGCTKVVEL